MTETKFPIKLTATSAAWSELYSCEYGSYEDHIERDDNGGVRRLEPYNRIREDGTALLHIVEILGRQKFKTVVYLNNQDEVDEFFGQAFTGTFGLVDGFTGNTGFQRTAQRLWRELRPHVSDEVAARAPYGGIGY